MSSSLEYTLIKHSLNGLTKYLAKYLANSKVRFNNVVIGGIKNNQDKEICIKIIEKVASPKVYWMQKIYLELLNF